ncbi:MAG: DUF4280 domain-containing protein [Oscillospiraceae bacterium]|nr:DUF4280 domain-containing protein [Oscillospiraceae bacterium]
MAICACVGANMMCPFGTAPATLVANSQTTVLGPSGPLATIMDNKPGANVPTFGMCNNPANPATVRPPPVFFTPAPCVPNTSAPWMPGSSTVLIGGFPALNNSSTLMCAWGGVISMTNPGQTSVMVP